MLFRSVKKTVGARNRLWYQRTFTVPRQWRGQRVLLLTGAQHASRDRGVPLHLAMLACACAGALVVCAAIWLRPERRGAAL